jgi:5-deoxy-D-glucuronate isomerase
MSRGPDLAKRAVWRRRLRDFERSSETVGEFCDRVGVSVNTFYRWQRKLARLTAPGEGCRATPALATPVRATSSRGAGPAMNFLPIEITAATRLEVVEVLFPSGARLTVPCHDHEVIRTVLSSLLAVGATSTPREDREC